MDGKRTPILWRKPSGGEWSGRAALLSRPADRLLRRVTPRSEAESDQSRRIFGLTNVSDRVCAEDEPFGLEASLGATLRETGVSLVVQGGQPNARSKA